MSTNSLFDSISDPIPSLRSELQIIPVQENGDSFLYLHDPRGYAPSNITLMQQARPLLNLIDGNSSINNLNAKIKGNITEQDLLEFVQFLDENCALNSSYFKQHAQDIEQSYEESIVHQSVTAGQSYPADAEELKTYLNEAFENHEHDSKETTDTPRALYAPHIDPRVGLESYVEAFSSIKDLNPKRVVIIATSHYAGLYPDIYKDAPFVLVNKDFELPLGTIKRDQQSITQLKDQKQQAGITLQDRAHRMEHSIELHLLFLSYLWDHDFTVVPFLTRGLQDLYYMEEGMLGKQLENFSDLLQQNFANDEDTFFLISGDLAHFGKKFGDNSPATALFDEVASFDEQFLTHGAANQSEKMLELMKSNMDSYRMCGFPPLYTFLQCMPDLQGETLSYDRWDERERESAVTFGSILYS